MKNKSSRMCRSLTSPSGMMALARAAISSEMRRPTNTVSSEDHALRNDWRAAMTPCNRATEDDTINYRSRQPECAACPQKDRCCPNAPFRKITRSIHEEEQDAARRISLTPEYERSRMEHKKVKIFFAHLKRILRLDKQRLRSSSGAQVEFLLGATAQNLRRMAKWHAPVAKEADLIPA